MMFLRRSSGSSGLSVLVVGQSFRMFAGFEGSFVFRHSRLVEFVFVAGVIRYLTADGVRQLFDYVGRVV